jgi:hypothetical protein
MESQHQTRPLKEPVASPTTAPPGEPVGGASVSDRLSDVEERLARLEQDSTSGQATYGGAVSADDASAPAADSDVLAWLRSLDARLVVLEKVSREGAMLVRRHLLSLVAFVEREFK